jgi:DNA-binding phage protein
MKQTKKRVFEDYQEKLLQDLRDPGLALAYLNEAIKDDDPRIFLLALQNVLESQGIPATSIKKNPTLVSILALLNAAGYSLAVQPQKK